MADKFAYDTDKGQEMSRRLASILQNRNSGPSRPSSPPDALGAGPVANALSEYDRLASAFEQEHSQSVKGSSDAFSGTSTDVSGIDVDLTADVKGI